MRDERCLGQISRPMRGWKDAFHSSSVTFNRAVIPKWCAFLSNDRPSAAGTI
jgi:hypothetical protein